MAASNFQPCLKWVLMEEGGNDDDPHDHGGRTSRGITQKEYDCWCELNKSPSGDVWQATQATIDTIYHVSYWNPWCDNLWGGLDLVFFDSCVNQGQARAVQHLQHALNVSVDGHFGVVTAHAVRQAMQSARQKVVLEGYLAANLAFYHRLEQSPDYARYAHGWNGRAQRQYERALQMVETGPAKL